MDVVGSIYSLTVGIIQYVSEHEHRDEISLQIYNTTVTIQQIIKPLQKHQMTEPGLRHTLHGLQASLSLIDNHLIAWEHGPKRIYGLVNPWAVTQELQSDLNQLMLQYIMLMGALQAIQFTRSYTVWRPAGHGGANLMPPWPNAHISQAGDVWRTFLGKQADFCGREEFMAGISQYLRRSLTFTERQRLLLKLDEENSGYVFRSTFTTLIGPAKVPETISYYTSNPPLPLLIWVDDHLQNNTWGVEEASKYGITVVQLKSTESAKRWINVNRGFLRRNDHPGSIRYITDQIRTELGKDGAAFTNFHAGAQITTFIRHKMKLEAPILVFTIRRRLPITEYVKSFRNTGSTSFHNVVQLYISQLGGRRGETPLLTYNTAC